SDPSRAAAAARSASRARRIRCGSWAVNVSNPQSLHIWASTSVSIERPRRLYANFARPRIGITRAPDTRGPPQRAQAGGAPPANGPSSGWLAGAVTASWGRSGAAVAEDLASGL